MRERKKKGARSAVTGEGFEIQRGGEKVHLNYLSSGRGCKRIRGMRQSRGRMTLRKKDSLQKKGGGRDEINGRNKPAK